MNSRKVVLSPIDADNLLASMELSREGLIYAVRYAQHERSFVTANDLLGFGSYLAYAKMGRALRDWYLPKRKGWVRDNSHNQVAIKHPKLNIRIVPCNFNQFAGNPDKAPTNRSPKGEVSRVKSECNMAVWLPGLEPPVIEPTRNNGLQTWLLGAYIVEGKPIGAELSFPIEFDGNHFTRFGKRIMLISGQDDKQVGRRSKGSDDDAVGIVDITVKRK